MKVAIYDELICEDNSLKLEIYKIKFDEDINVLWSCLTNKSELLKLIKKEIPDVFILNMDNCENLGFEIVKEIRKKDLDCLIIFISSSDKYIFESFNYNPFRYIIRSRVDTELQSALESAFMLHKTRKRNITVVSDGVIYRIQENEIIYAQVAGRKLSIHLTNNRTLYIWKTLREFIEELKGVNCIKINSGCLVNIQYIKKFIEHEVILKNDEKLLVSRSATKMLKTILLQNTQ